MLLFTLSRNRANKYEVQVTCNCDFGKQKKKGNKKNKTTTNLNWKEKKLGRKKPPRRGKSYKAGGKALFLLCKVPCARMSRVL